MQDNSAPKADTAHAPRAALITGAARRIGAQIARTLHGAGASVAITYRGSREEAEALCAELNAARPDSALALHADFAADTDYAGLVDRVARRFGGLDVLVNNASSFYPTPLGKITERAWQELVGSNLKAPMFLTQAAAPLLGEHGGSVINMVDIHARRPLARHVVYCAAKAGLAMLTLSLARELGPAVRVNGIAPGPVLWPESGLDDGTKAKIIANTALKRPGSPADIAGLVLYLVRDAGYITGQIIAVDGGRSAGW